MKKELQNAYIINTKKVLKKYNDEVVKVQVAGLQADLEGKLQEQKAGLQVELDQKETIVNVDSKIATAKEEVVRTAKAYADEKVEQVNGEISKVQARIVEVDEKIDTEIEGVAGSIDEKIAELKVEVDSKDGVVLEQAKAYVDAEIVKVDGKVAGEIAGIKEEAQELAGKVEGLAGRVDTVEGDISNLKDVVSNKNNNTIVVDTEAEIAIANPTPKVGDMAYVIYSKRAYIFKGVEALIVAEVPAGWVVFDEITSELDLVDYLKKADAQVKFEEIEGKLDEKASKVELAQEVQTLNDKIDGLVINGGDTTQEIEAVKGRVEVVEGQVAGQEVRIAALETAGGHQLTDEEVQDIIDFILA